MWISCVGKHTHTHTLITMLLSVPSDWARCRGSRQTARVDWPTWSAAEWARAPLLMFPFPVKPFFPSDRAFREPHQKGLKSPQKKNGNWRWSELTKSARASEQDTYLFISTFFFSDFQSNLRRTRADLVTVCFLHICWKISKSCPNVLIV